MILFYKIIWLIDDLMALGYEIIKFYSRFHHLADYQFLFRGCKMDDSSLVL